MNTCPDLVVCPQCDTVFARPTLEPGATASCTRCGALLLRESRLGIDAWLALTITAALLLLSANLLPVIGISLQGHVQQTTLTGTVLALCTGLTTLIAIPTALFIIVFPMAQLLILIWILGFALCGKASPGLIVLLRTLDRLHPWGMVEVCWLGVLVALVKLASHMQIQFLPGLWFLGAAMALIVVVSNRERSLLWSLRDAGNGKVQAMS